MCSRCTRLISFIYNF